MARLIDRVPLIVVRHASTALNSTTSSECIRGHLDVKLSPEGRAEAKATGEKLKLKQFDVIVASDLSRAVDTAKTISQATGVPIVEVTRDARPWDVGSWAGRPIPNCTEKLVDFIRNKPDTVVGGGESFNDFANRFFDCIDDIRRKYAGKTVLLVTHHRGERLLQASLEGGADLSEDDIEPNAFLRKGIGPAEFRDDIVLARGDRDDDEDDVAQPRSKPSLPWNTKPIEPRINDPQRNLWTFSPGGKLDGTGAAADPFDLDPPVPLRKRSQSWANTVLEPMKRGR
jgi:broad specificity phosphatase PhoE